MEYGLSDEQRALCDAVADVLAAHADPRMAYTDDPVCLDESLWRRLCELGLPGLAVADRYDGSGAGPIELALVCEQMGYAVAPVPLVGHAVAAEAIAVAGDSEVARTWLSALAAGSKRATYVPDGPGIDPRPRVEVTDVDSQGGTLNGAIPLVLDAVDVDLVLVPANDGEVYAVDATTVRIDVQPSMDRTRPASSVLIEGVRAPRLGDAGRGPHIQRRAGALLWALEAAEAVGAATWALERTQQHAVQREQFGLPIGTFQAVKHRLADMLVAVENARSASYGAAWALAAEPGACAVNEVAMAQAFATQAAVQVVADAVQLHGGIGVTWENDLHLRLRRVKTLQLLHGSPDWHREQLAAALLDDTNVTNS